MLIVAQCSINQRSSFSADVIPVRFRPSDRYVSDLAVMYSRWLISHAFSDKVLRDREYIIQQYVDLLIEHLYKTVHGDAQGKADLVR